MREVNSVKVSWEHRDRVGVIRSSGLRGPSEWLIFEGRQDEHCIHGGVDHKQCDSHKHIDKLAICVVGVVRKDFI